MDVKEYTRCRLCSGELLDLFSLGETEPANALLENQGQKNNKYPLDLCICSSCSSIQLKHSVNPELLFKHYLYSSSTVPSLVEHFRKYALDVSSILPQNFNRKVLDIGSNDGVLIREFKACGFEVLGVEPSNNLSKLANEEGLTTENSFFNLSTSETIKDKFGLFSIITCNNCFAHIDNISSVLEGIDNLLEKDGLFIFENAYLLDTIKGMYFDQLYSEHIFYHSLKPLKILLEKYNFEIFNVQRNNIQGGTIRVFVKRVGSKKWQVKDSLNTLLEQEENENLYSVNRYVNFKNDIDASVSRFNSFMSTELSKGKTFSAFGAAAKYVTFTSVFGIEDKLKYVVDNSKIKCGLFTPSGKVKIVSPQELIKNPTDYCIITAWNFADYIIKNNKDYKGKFIIPFPELKIV